MSGGVAAGAFGALLVWARGVDRPAAHSGFGLPFERRSALAWCVIGQQRGRSVYLQRDVANLRLGMTLEMFTAIAARPRPDRVHAAGSSVATCSRHCSSMSALTMVRARDAREARAFRRVGPRGALGTRGRTVVVTMAIERPLQPNQRSTVAWRLAFRPRLSHSQTSDGRPGQLLPGS